VRTNAIVHRGEGDVFVTAPQGDRPQRSAGSDLGRQLVDLARAAVPNSAHAELTLVTGDRWQTLAGTDGSAPGGADAVDVEVDVEGIGRARLTVRADRAGAFDDTTAALVRLFGPLVELTVAGRRDRERATNLEIALDSNRQIGIAIGILMARDLVTADQAFDRLRDASQRTHRKLRSIADDVVNTGQLPSGE
jgi:hypothetical protein